MFKQSGSQDSTWKRVVAASAFVSAIYLSGCASGSFSNSGSPSTPATVSPNPPSLPPLAAVSTNNTYVGTQESGPSSPENVITLQLNDAASSYVYKNIAFSNTPYNPVLNTSGLSATFADYTALGDTTGQSGLPGAQYFGLAAEIPSRLAIFGNLGGQQVTAAVPLQTKSCITPTAAATYQFVTLFNSNFVPATDAAWGTVSIAASNSGFEFTNASEYIQPGSKSQVAATTSLIPFSAGTCTESKTEPAAGFFIDSPASSATNNIEVRSFLGPTGFLSANVEGVDTSGNPLALPGVIGMIQPSAPINITDVTGTAATLTTYRAFVYQPTGPTPVQYGFFGQSTEVLTSVNDQIFTETKTAGFQGVWTSLASPTNVLSAGNGTGGIVFGTQDPKNPGLFPDAQYLYETTDSCMPGSKYLGKTTISGESNSFCISPAIAMVGLHDGKYVVLATGTYQAAGGIPTVLILVEQ